jgi:hypothetical protein
MGDGLVFGLPLVNLLDFADSCDTPIAGGPIDGQHSVTTNRGPVAVMEISCEYFSPSIFFTDHHASQISQFADLK